MSKENKKLIIYYQRVSKKGLTNIFHFVLQRLKDNDMHIFLKDSVDGHLSESLCERDIARSRLSPLLHSLTTNVRRVLLGDL